MQSPGDNDMGKSREQRTREARAAREAARIAAELEAANAATEAVVAPEAAPAPTEPETTAIPSYQTQTGELPIVPPSQPAPIVRTPIIPEPQPAVAQLAGQPQPPQQQALIQSGSGLQTSSQTGAHTDTGAQIVQEAPVPAEPPVRRRDGTMPATVQEPAAQPGSQAPATAPEAKPCRHEYVRIYQRKLKGLDRRLVATRAFLPVGFKMGDFTYLSPGSFCFCSKCRKRLFPKRTEAEKELARVERKALKEAGIADMMRARDKSIFDDELDEDLDEMDFSDDMSSFVKGGAAASKGAAAEEADENLDDDKLKLDIHVDELEVESVDVEDIKAEGVKITPLEDDFDEACSLDVDEDV